MAKVFDLAYGNEYKHLEIPDNIPTLTLLPKDMPGLANPTEAVAQALADPAGTEPLVEMLRKRAPERVTVVVNDETRPTPYDAIFPPLLDAFAQAGIDDDKVIFVIATGIHKPQSRELNARIYGEEMVSRFRFINHAGDDMSSLVDMGTTSSGYPCLINKLAVETDFLITLGVVMPHYFAGYSGGRKSILPGLAGHETVEKNHARMVELLDALPPIGENPVSIEMIEVARKVGVDFIINVVTNERREVVSVQAGDLVQAWRKAVDVSAQMYEIPFTEMVDITITCASGYPRDVNVYQSQKALDHAERITRPGGCIIWVGKSQEGFGEKVFEKWLNKRLAPVELLSQFRNNFELGGHKAYAIAKVASTHDVAFISDMTAPETELMFVRKEEDLQKAFDAAIAKYGPNASVAVLPQGGLTLPVRGRV